MTHGDHGDHGPAAGGDPHALLFGQDPVDDHDGLSFGPDDHDQHPSAVDPAGLLADDPGAVDVEGRHPSGPFADGLTGRPTRSEDRRHRRNRRRRAGRRRVLLLMTLGLVVIVGLSLWFVVRPLYNDRFHPKDYSGQGTGSVVIKINAGDGASDIAHTLLDDGVVASTRAFTNAASNNSKSKLIQPGAYRLRHHMSAKNAVSLLLDPASRVSTSLVIPEGVTSFDIVDNLAKALNLPLATVRKQLADVSQLALPNSYRTASGGAPTTVEGFLYPATYQFDPGTSVVDAANQIINSFIDQDRNSGFSTDAQTLGITPYAALIIASIAQSEAKYPADMAKVARVILNRIKAKMPLQIDATTRYGALLDGKDPSSVRYDSFPTPYNSYLHDGLPPSPISNPGHEAMDAVVHPPAGPWLYYVNGDAAGHLFFTDNPQKFAAAVEKCRKNNWGCG